MSIKISEVKSNLSWYNLEFDHERKTFSIFHFSSIVS